MLPTGAGWVEWTAALANELQGQIIDLVVNPNTPSALQHSNSDAFTNAQNSPPAIIQITTNHVCE